MPLFPSDFKKFKYVSSDDKTTTLAHDKGHEIKIAHSALSPAMRTQLLAMGGAVEEAKRAGMLGTGPKVDQQMADTKQDMAVRRAPANDGKDVRSDEQKAKAAEYEQTGILPKWEPKKAEGGEVMMASGGQIDDETNSLVNDLQIMPDTSQQAVTVDPAQARAKEIYNNLSSITSPTGPDLVSPAPGGTFSGSTGPKDFNPPLWSQARQKEAEERTTNAANTAAEQQRIIAENQSRVDAGLPPLPVPNVPEGPQPSLNPSQDISGSLTQPQGIAPQPQAPASSIADPSSMLQKGYNQSLAGINATAKAQGDLGNEQATIFQQQQEATAQLQSQYKQDYDALDMERQHLVADIQDGHVSPEKFWDNHSKIATGIGMILAGFNPTNSPNAAINFLKAQMEQNLEAQKANLSSKQSLLSANLQQFGNMRQAMDMTRVMQADVVKNQLESAAAKATSPLAKAAALKAAGEINAAYAPLFQKVATQASMAKLTSGANQDPSKLPALIDAIAVQDPDRAKEMRGRLVPGLGLTNDLEGAKGLREMQATVKTVRSGIQRLREITKQTGKSMSPTLRSEADSLRTQLIGRLRVPITGPGAMSEGERELLMQAIPSATDMFSLDSKTLKKLDTLEKGVVGNYRNMAVANGLTVPEQAATQGADPKRAQAEAWLKANPNHPQAAARRKLLGL